MNEEVVSVDIATKVQMLKALVGDGDSDETLTIYLMKAKELLLNIIYPTEANRAEMEVPAMYEMKQIEIAEYFLNKRGAEGEIQHIENGIHRNYGSSDVPEAMIRHITPFCGVVK